MNSYTPHAPPLQRFRATWGNDGTARNFVVGTLMVIGLFVAVAVVATILSIALALAAAEVGIVGPAPGACGKPSPPARCSSPNPLPQEPQGPMKL